MARKFGGSIDPSHTGLASLPVRSKIFIVTCVCHPHKNFFLFSNKISLSAHFYARATYSNANRARWRTGRACERWLLLTAVRTFAARTRNMNSTESGSSASTSSNHTAVDEKRVRAKFVRTAGTNDSCVIASYDQSRTISDEKSQATRAATTCAPSEAERRL